MARQIREKNIEPIIETAQHWIKQSLVGDYSSLSSGPLWTAENIAAVRQAFTDNPDESDDDFFTKLKRQMAPASSAAQHLIAEMLWALLLFPTRMNAATKRERVMDLWSLSGDPVPRKAEYLNDSVLSGIGSGGIGYHNHRWRELKFLIELAGDLKRHNEHVRKRVFDDYDEFIDWISKVPHDGERQFRHMLRYFAFPDLVERISSNQDRFAVLEAFGVATNKTIKKWTDREVDQALADLRAKLQSEYPATLLDFYEEPLLNRWRPKRTSSKPVAARVAEVSTKARSAKSRKGIKFDANVLAESFAAIEASNLVIERHFFTRIVCALLAKPFLILTGNSGTGKTKLAESFAKWLCRNETDQVALVAVGADWTDNRNVLGFVNHLRTTTVRENRTRVELPVYQTTRILDLVLRATQNFHQPHFLVLDEMNLSHVERYFADFLSALELRHGGIVLHREGRALPRTPDGPRDVPQTITLPDNLFVIGTVNVDETTYMFSPKVLDRANVIEFRVSPESPRKFLESTHNITPIASARAGCAEGFLELSLRVRGLAGDAPGFDSKFQQQVEECHTAIEDLFSIMYTRRQEFAFRTMSEVLRFLSVDCALTSRGDEWSSHRALDAQILQKILPKLHGSKRKIGSLLAALAHYCANADREAAIAILSNEANNELHVNGSKHESPRFVESYLKLCEMMDAVRRDQFVSFIQ